jgi:hypothetical protein
VEQELIRTCSAAQADVLARAAGRCARVGSAWVCVRELAGAGPIDRCVGARYQARVEVLDTGPDSGSSAPDELVRVLSDLFGAYLT